MKIYASKSNGSGITVDELFNILNCTWIKTTFYDHNKAKVGDRNSVMIGGKLDELLHNYPELKDSEIVNMNISNNQLTLRIIPGFKFTPKWVYKLDPDFWGEQS